MRKTKACEGHLPKRGTEWVFSFDERNSIKAIFFLIDFPYSLLPFHIQRKSDLTAAHHRFAQREEGCARQMMRCIVNRALCIVHSALQIALCIVNCARQVMR